MSEKHFEKQPQPRSKKPMNPRAAHLLFNTITKIKTKN
jgi:hypothetical protein